MIPLQLFVQRRIVSLPKTASAQLAVKAMYESSVGCVLVTDDQNHLEGIVTDRDLACVGMGMNIRSDKIPLSDIMTHHPLCVEQTDDLEHVVYLMEESGIRRIPVVERLSDQSLKCIGLITLDDLVASKQIDYDHVARIVKSQIERRNVLRRYSSTKRSKNAPSVVRSRPSLNQFYQHIQANTGLTEQNLYQITEKILSSLVRKLSYTGAAHLISLLPEGLREHLLELPPGPDQRETLVTLKEDLSVRYGLSPKEVLILLENFFHALAETLPHEEVQQLHIQLPEEFRALLPDQIQGKKTRHEATQIGYRLKPKNKMKLIWAVDPFGKEKKLQRDTALAIQAFIHRLSSVVEPIYVGSPNSLNDPLSSMTDNVQDLNSYGENKLVKILAGVQLPGRQKFNILLAQQGNRREEARTLIEYAKTTKADLIVIGTRAHRGPKRWIMGSFAETLAQSSDFPLLVVNPFWKPLKQFKSILFATDFSDHSRAAFKRVLALAKLIKTKIFILHSLDYEMHIPAEMVFLKHPPIPFISKEEIERFRTLGLSWAEEGKREGIKCQVIVDTRIGESPAEAILRRSKKLPGIIALAAYSGPVSRALLGSTTRKVIRASRQPVWVIHPQLQNQINEVTANRPESRSTREAA